MDTLIIISQVIIALGIYNVWILRTGNSTAWRGGEAKTMQEEFAVYGLPRWAMLLVGALKLTFATALLVGIWIPELTKPAAVGLAFLMLGAIVVHFKVGDPVKKSVPAASVLLLSLAVVS